MYEGISGVIKMSWERNARGSDGYTSFVGRHLFADFFGENRETQWLTTCMKTPNTKYSGLKFFFKNISPP